MLLKHYPIENFIINSAQFLEIWRETFEGVVI